MGIVRAAGSLLFVCVSFVKTTCAAIQQPLSTQDAFVGPYSSWRFNYSSSAPHYFSSVYGLLQQWPNTFFPNGHSIAACEIPPLTKFYHGRIDGHLPNSPEWLAFDIGMSFGIMGSTRNSYMLTYQTTRPVRCLYFDGESATLLGEGRMDSQMLHIYGNVSGIPMNGRGFRGLWDEYARASGLCTWLDEKHLGGPGWGFEGIIRMNAGFEVIWCNFTSPSLHLISQLNITAPLLGLPKNEQTTGVHQESTPASYFPLPPSQTHSDKATGAPDSATPPNWRRDFDREPFLKDQGWAWFVSATKHYGSSGLGAHLGESRAKVLSCGILNYYSPVFERVALSRALKEQITLNLTQEGYWMGPGTDGTRQNALNTLMRRRRLHTLHNASNSDAALMRSSSERVLADILNQRINCSGIDWTIISNDIVQEYAGNLKTLLLTLEKYDSTSSNRTKLRGLMVDIRSQTHMFLLPFLEYPASMTDAETWRPDSSLFSNTFSRCQFDRTRLLDPAQGMLLSPEESTLKWAVEEISRGICSVIIDIGFAMEWQWISNFNEPRDITNLETRGLDEEVLRWIHGLQELMAWLGWAGEWAQCDRKCAPDERCFIPMWPLLARGNDTYYPPEHGPYYPPHYPFDEVPPYLTGIHMARPPPRNDSRWWIEDETDLWEPKCVKADYIMG